MIETIIIEGQYENPNEWVGNNVICGLCEKEAEFDDQYCENHQSCKECGAREICEDECIIYK